MDCRYLHGTQLSQTGGSSTPVLNTENENEFNSMVAGDLYGKLAMPAYISVEQVSSRGNGRSLTADPKYYL
jgi:hypothetical protein